jgi:hypothetical protein
MPRLGPSAPTWGSGTPGPYLGRRQATARSANNNLGSRKGSPAPNRRRRRIDTLNHPDRVRKSPGKRIVPCHKVICPSTLQIRPGARRLPHQGNGGVSEWYGDECSQGQARTPLRETHSSPWPAALSKRYWAVSPGAGGRRGESRVSPEQVACRIEGPPAHSPSWTSVQKQRAAHDRARVARARCFTSASRSCPPGLSDGRTPWPTGATGRRWWPCRSSTAWWSGRRSATCCRWRRRSTLAVTPGRPLGGGLLTGKYSGRKADAGRVPLRCCGRRCRSAPVAFRPAVA